MYGKRLRPRDYSDLINCRTVSEVAEFLKSKTIYSKDLSSLTDQEIHRGQLEMLLRKKFFSDCASLCRYEFSTGQHFSEYLIESFEIEQIMHGLMFLSAGKASNYFLSMPTFFLKHTKMDLLAFSKMKNYDDFLEAVSSTKYAKELKRFKVQKNEDIDLPMVEHALLNSLYKKLFQIIETYSRGSEKKELLEMMNIYIDVKNFVRILRLKKYYNSDSNFIKSCLFEFGNLKNASIQEMINAYDENEIISIMRSTNSGHKLGKIDITYIDKLYEKVRFNLSRKNIRFSVNSAVVMFSYVFLLDIEISNIINIIEGVRYSVPGSEIDKILVYRKG